MQWLNKNVFKIKEAALFQAATQLEFHQCFHVVVFNLVTPMKVF